MAKAEAAAAESSVVETLGKLIPVLVEDAEARRVTRDVPLHLAKMPTPWNPSGEARRVKLKWKYLTQNGARANADLMTDEEIELVNQLKPGAYNHKKIVVSRRKDKSLDIAYATKKIEDRMELKNYARNLAELAKNILIEQEDQARRRKAGDIDEDDD